MKLPILACSLLFGLIAHSAMAQVASDPSRRAEVLPKTNLPPVEQGASAAVQPGESLPNVAGTNSDIGEQRILRETPKPRRFRFNADTFIYRTDNAAHVSEGELEDWFYGGRVSAGWQMPISQRWVFDLGASQDAFQYDELEVLNFESLEANASVIYGLPWIKDFYVIGQYQFSRLTQDFEDLVQSHSGRLILQKVFTINRRSSLTASMLGDWDIETDVDSLKRNQYSAGLAWTFKLIPKVNLVVGYSYVFYDYTEYDRQDHLHNASASLSWTPAKWLEVYLGYSATFNRSSVEAFDYDDGTAGFGLGCRLRF